MSEHVVPVKIYVAVFVTLLVMTAATTAISGLDLGPWNTVVAFGIAVFKASLVILFFMHAKYSPRLTHMVILAGHLLARAPPPDHLLRLRQPRLAT